MAGWASTDTGILNINSTDAKKTLRATFDNMIYDFCHFCSVTKGPIVGFIRALLDLLSAISLTMVFHKLPLLSATHF
jgi:hypothetical protein